MKCAHLQQVMYRHLCKSVSPANQNDILNFPAIEFKVGGGRNEGKGFLHCIVHM